MILSACGVVAVVKVVFVVLVSDFHLVLVDIFPLEPHLSGCLTCRFMPDNKLFSCCCWQAWSRLGQCCYWSSVWTKWLEKRCRLCCGLYPCSWVQRSRAANFPPRPNVTREKATFWTLSSSLDIKIAEAIYREQVSQFRSLAFAARYLGSSLFSWVGAEVGWSVVSKLDTG